MPDATTTLGLAALASYVGKDPLQRLLGPTCDMLGRRFSDLTESGIDAVGRIVRNARAKAGDALEQPGSVPPRVLKEVIDAGSGYTEDINIEYMGGVLASSRTPQGRDDRGARMAKLVDRLTTYQLRTHYLIYASIRHLFSERPHKFERAVDRRHMQIFVPLSSYMLAMEYIEVEEFDSMVRHTYRIEEFDSMVPHTFSGLESENLIYEKWMFGTVDELKELIDHTAIKKDAGDVYMTRLSKGLICSPTLAGAELFVWAFGHGQKRPDFMFDKSFSAHIDGLPPYLEGAMVAIAPSESSSSETS